MQVAVPVNDDKDFSKLKIGRGFTQIFVDKIKNQR